MPDSSQNKNLKNLQSLFSRKEGREIARTFQFAKKAHQGQKRKSGEDFIEHPLSVALILAQEGMDLETIQAAILHDTLEDTTITSEEILEEFGETILDLVQGITKIEKATEQRGKNYRKMLLAAASDARVILIKMADRVHNLRTIQPLAQEKRERIARETLEVYAPLAHRLGLSKIKTELEDRSLQIINPQAYEEAGLIQKERLAASEKEMEELKNTLNQVLKKNGLQKVEISARLKSRFSIAEKLERKSREQIWDIVGLRVIVQSRKDCYVALGAIHNLWPPLAESFDDYIAVPRANLYQSLHTTVMTQEGRPIEIQIRTAEMNELAERGIGAHWLYKENLRGGGPASTQKYLQAIAENQKHQDDLENLFQDLKRDIFQEDTYFFTPKGDIKILPKGANAIDFAYSIHSDIGHSITGARIDGRMQSISKEITGGSVVEIITRKNGTPNRDWLKSVRTNRARNRIRSFFADEIDRERSEEGLSRISEALKQQNLQPLSQRTALVEALEKIGYPDPEEAGRLALKNKTVVREMVEKISRQYAESRPRLETSFKEPAPGRQKDSGAVRVEGMEGIATRLAGCCNPEPGDMLVGYTSLGRGISVHRFDCPEIVSWKKRAPEKLIRVEWESDPAEYPIRITFRFLDRMGLLGEIIQTVYDFGGELKEINSRSDSHVARGKLTVQMSSQPQGDLLRQELKKIPGCLEIARS